MSYVIAQNFPNNTSGYDTYLSSYISGHVKVISEVDLDSCEFTFTIYLSRAKIFETEIDAKEYIRKITEDDPENYFESEFIEIIDYEKRADELMIKDIIE